MAKPETNGDWSTLGLVGRGLAQKGGKVEMRSQQLRRCSASRIWTGEKVLGAGTCLRVQPET